MSSLYFFGNDTSYLKIPNNEFNFGTGDCTIEWYQYQMDKNPFPRIFQVGEYSVGISIGVSIETYIDPDNPETEHEATFYYWMNGTPYGVTTLTSTSYKNTWVHFAISRASGITTIFMNGRSIGSVSSADEINDDFNTTTSDLTISNESTPTTSAAFGGYLTYFTWVKGVAKYTENFTVSNNYPYLTNDYVLLLTADNFVGTLGNMVINTNVLTTSNVPPNFLTKPPPPTKSRPQFSDNSLVFYKSGSLASCGVGTVRNSSTKSRRI